MYFVFIECEYKKGWLSSQEYSDNISDKHWYQYLTDWDPKTEEFKWSDGDVCKIIKRSQPPVYFNSLKEAKEVAKIVKIYSITEEVEESACGLKTNIINWKVYVDSKKG